MDDCGGRKPVPIRALFSPPTDLGSARAASPCRLLSLITVVVAAWIALPVHGQSPVLEPTLAKLGPTGHAEKREVSFTIRNPGSTPLSFTMVKESCSCLDVRFDASPIPAGESRDGTVVVSLGRGYSRFHKKVDFSIAGRRDPLTLHIMAQFHPGIRVGGMEVVLDAHEGGGGPMPSAIYEIISVVPKGPPPEVTDVTIVRGDHLTARLVEPEIDRARLEIAVAPDHPEGLVQGEVRVKVNGRTLQIPVRGSVFRGVRLEPARLNFNVVRTPEDLVERIELVSVDDRTLTIGEPRVVPNTARRGTGGPPPSLEVRVLPREEGGAILEVTLEVTEGFTGGFAGTVVVPTGHPDKPEVEIPYFGHVPAPGS